MAAHGNALLSILVVLTTAACGRVGFSSIAQETDAESSERDANNEIDADTTSGLAPALARYWINEASMAQGVPALLDDTPNPFPIPLSYGANIPVFDDRGVGGRHIRFSGDEDVGGLAPIRGTKFEALHQATTATLEMKLLVDGCDSATSQQRMFGFSDGVSANDSWLGIRSWNPQGGAQRVGLVLTWAGRSLWTFFYTEQCPDTLNVLHWVVDTNQARPEDRVRSYLDGVRTPVLFFGNAIGDSDWPPLGATIDLRDSVLKPQQMYVGQALDGLPRASGERIYYMAVYREALSEAQIVEHTTILSAIDD